MGLHNISVSSDESEQSYFDVHPSENHGFEIYEVFSIESMRVSMDYSISLNAYMNFISFYGLPEDPSVSVVMQDIAGNIDNVQGLGISAQYFPLDNSWQGSLQTLDIKSGYWLRMTDDAILEDNGFPYNIKREYDLHVGPNLISFPSVGSFNITDALPDDIENNITVIIGENAAAVATLSDSEELALHSKVTS